VEKYNDEGLPVGLHSSHSPCCLHQ